MSEVINFPTPAERLQQSLSDIHQRIDGLTEQAYGPDALAREEEKRQIWVAAVQNMSAEERLVYDEQERNSTDNETEYARFLRSLPSFFVNQLQYNVCREFGIIDGYELSQLDQTDCFMMLSKMDEELAATVPRRPEDLPALGGEYLYLFLNTDGSVTVKKELKRWVIAKPETEEVFGLPSEELDENFLADILGGFGRIRTYLEELGQTIRANNNSVPDEFFTIINDNIE